MTVLRESPWYQTILQEGLIQEEQRGRQEGEKTEAITFINRLIKRPFGDVKENIRLQLQNLSVEQLELLGESLFDFTSMED